MSELFDRIGRPNAFVWQVAVIAVVPSMLLVLAGPWARTGGSPLPWLGYAVLGTAAASLAMVPFRATALRAGARPSRPWLTLLAFALAGSIRGVLIGQLAFADGAMAQPETLQRLVGGALNGVVYLSIIALMVQSVRDHSDSIGRLRQQKRKLAAARNSAHTELQRVSAEVVERVRSQLLIRLEALLGGINRDPRQLPAGGDALVELIDATLKPLVDEISSRPGEWHFEPEESEDPFGWESASLFADSTVVSPINAQATAVAIALAGSASFIPLAGPARMLVAAVIVGAGLWLLLSLLAAPMRRASSSLGAAGRAVVLTLLLEASALVVTAIVLLAWRAAGLRLESQVYVSLMLASPLVVVLVGWGIAVTAAWNRRADEVDSDLAATVELLRAQVAFIEAAVSAERDRLARFVHGPVQDHLIAAWGLLERVDGAAPDESAVAAATELITAALELLGQRISNPTADVDAPPTVAELVGDYASVWEGLVEIHCEVEPTAGAALANDPVAAGAAAEVIREAIANAARHARSERINVVVRAEAPGFVKVFVESDFGAGGASTREPVSGRRGLGSRTLDQVTASWTLDKLDSGALLSASIEVNSLGTFV